MDESSIKKFFVSKDEKYIASMGSGFIKNYLLDNKVTSGFAVLSDRRIYFRGKCYATEFGNKLKLKKTERIVDLQDITGTGSSYESSIVCLWAGIITTIIALLVFLSEMLYGESDSVSTIRGDGFISTFMMITSIILFIMYWLSRKTIFIIQYNGGQIAFNNRLYSKEEVDKFHRSIRECKDALDNDSRCSNTTYNEIQNYYELLKSGAITEEEYKNLKSKIM